MQFELGYTAKEEHIDFQGIMDGLYYPFYLEDCRHKFIEEAMKFDMKAESALGTNMVLAQYIIKFIRPLKKGDKFIATCSAHPDKAEKPVFHLRQTLVKDGKLVVAAFFTATCVPAAGGRPFIPASVASFLASSEATEGVAMPSW